MGLMAMKISTKCAGYAVRNRMAGNACSCHGLRARCQIIVFEVEVISEILIKNVVCDVA